MGNSTPGPVPVLGADDEGLGNVIRRLVLADLFADFCWRSPTAANSAASPPLPLKRILKLRWINPDQIILKAFVQRVE